MKHAPKTKPLMSEDGEIMGLSLDADHTAEHECGIEGLRMLFKMSGDDVLGVDRHLIGTFPEHKLALIDEGHDLTLIAPRPWRMSEDGDNCATIDGVLVVTGKPDNYSPDAYIPRGYEDANGRYKIPRGNDKKSKAELIRMTAGFYGAWDSNGFAVTARGADAQRFLRTLIEAMRAKDLTISIGGSGPFRNGALNLLIASKIPESVRLKAYEESVDYRNLISAASSTGIENIVREAGLKYFALRPKWADDSKSTVVFWLNPREQQIHNYGLFTVDDLKAWAEGRGPVMKSNGKSDAADAQKNVGSR